VKFGLFFSDKFFRNESWKTNQYIHSSHFFFIKQEQKVVSKKEERRKKEEG
jgi:hypothetical protein